MALPLSQKALRAVQDTISLHQTLRCRYAAGPPLDRLRTESMPTRGVHDSKSMSSAARERRLAVTTTLVDTLELEVDVLGGRCGLGKGIFCQADAD
jgi:hypothetical protein